MPQACLTPELEHHCLRCADGQLANPFMPLTSTDASGWLLSHPRSPARRRIRCAAWEPLVEVPVGAVCAGGRSTGEVCLVAYLLLYLAGQPFCWNWVAGSDPWKFQP